MVRDRIPDPTSRDNLFGRLGLAGLRRLLVFLIGGLGEFSGFVDVAKVPQVSVSWNLLKWSFPRKSSACFVNLLDFCFFFF